MNDCAEKGRLEEAGKSPWVNGRWPTYLLRTIEFTAFLLLWLKLDAIVSILVN